MKIRKPADSPMLMRREIIEWALAREMAYVWTTPEVPHV